MVYGTGTLDSFVLRRSVILKRFGFWLMAWMLFVSNVEPSQIDSVLVDIIKGNYYGAMVRCEDVIAADSDSGRCVPIFGVASDCDAAGRFARGWREFAAGLSI